MKKVEVTGVILAAGRGTRMRELGQGYPKPLLPVCNKPLIHHHIEQLRDLGISHIVVVIGHLGHQIVSYLGSNPIQGVSIRFIEQEKMLGIAHAVGCLEPILDNPFLVLLGDIAFHSTYLEALIEPFLEHEADAVLAVKNETSVDAIRKHFSVVVNNEGYASRVVEKPRVATTQLKGCGLYLFDQHIFDAIRKTPRTAARDEYEITDSIQILIDSGAKVKVAPVVDWDLNLTYSCDLLECNLYWKSVKFPDSLNLIGENCNINPKAVLRNVIVGDGVTIKHPIELSDSIVLSDSTVAQKNSLRRVVMSPSHTTECGVGIQANGS